MRLDKESLKFILGLKMGNLRKERGLSLKDLANATGLSASYLNEIENGKKYPKKEKLVQIASALDVNYDELVSHALSSELKKLSRLIENNPLIGLPLEIFGISPQDLFQFMIKNPESFAALSGTGLELARIFNIQIDDVFSAVLRAYLHMNGNFFPELEQQVEDFKDRYKVGDLKTFLQKEALKDFLSREFAIEVIETDFLAYPKPVHRLYYFVKSGGRRLQVFLNQNNISERQKVFILAREAAYAYLQIKDRFLFSSTERPQNYEQMYNLFTASYFASALILPLQSFALETKQFFERVEWQEDTFIAWIQSYPGTRRSFFHRLSQVLPSQIKLDNIFYFRFNYHPSHDDFRVIKELHLSELQVPHRLYGVEHYCRRWIATSLVKDLERDHSRFKVGIQRVSFVGTGREYLCFSMAYPLKIQPEFKEGITLGILIDHKARQTIAFLDDPAIPRVEASRFCEWCPIANCQERVAPPVALEQQKARETITNLITNQEG